MALEDHQYLRQSMISAVLHASLMPLFYFILVCKGTLAYLNSYPNSQERLHPSHPRQNFRGQGDMYYVSPFIDADQNHMFSST